MQSEGAQISPRAPLAWSNAVGGARKNQMGKRQTGDKEQLASNLGGYALLITMISIKNYGATPSRAPHTPTLRWRCRTLSGPPR